MRATEGSLGLLFILAAVANATRWDSGLDGDLQGEAPVPRITPLLSSNIHPLVNSVPIDPPHDHGSSRNTTTRSSGRLDRRQVCNSQFPTASTLAYIHDRMNVKTLHTR